MAGTDWCGGFAGTRRPCCDAGTGGSGCVTSARASDCTAGTGGAGYVVGASASDRTAGTGNCCTAVVHVSADGCASPCHPSRDTPPWASRFCCDTSMRCVCGLSGRGTSWWIPWGSTRYPGCPCTGAGCSCAVHSPGSAAGAISGRLGLRGGGRAEGGRDGHALPTGTPAGPLSRTGWSIALEPRCGRVDRRGDSATCSSCKGQVITCPGHPQPTSGLAGCAGPSGPRAVHVPPCHGVSIHGARALSRGGPDR